MRRRYKADIIHTFTSADTSSQVKRACMIDNEVNLESQTYSVCYLNQYHLIMRRSTKGKKPFSFVLGCDYSDVLFRAINYQYITIYSVIKSYGNDTKIEIIRELSKREMTISQLSRKLHLSRSSIGRYVEDLVEEVAVVRVKRVGADIYLRLNPEYFIQSKSAFINYVDNILLELRTNV
ncbi:MAG: winged helix-turn-helix domain-containing protein [Clostridia bacterium]